MSNELLKETAFAKIERVDGTIVKTFKKPIEYIDKEWLEHYKEFNKRYKNLVTVYEANRHIMVMEDIDGINLQEYTNQISKFNELDFHQWPITRVDLFNFIEFQLKALSDFFKYSAEIKKSWMHTDAGLHNTMLMPNNKMILIDPESIILSNYPSNNVFMQTFSHTMLCIQQMEVKELEVSYRLSQEDKHKLSREFSDFDNEVTNKIDRYKKIITELGGPQIWKT